MSRVVPTETRDNRDDCDNVTAYPKPTKTRHDSDFPRHLSYEQINDRCHDYLTLVQSSFIHLP